MRVALYAPLKPPDHPVPSGDRRMAQLLMEALQRAGHEPELAARLRSYDGTGDTERQVRLAELGGRLAARLLMQLRARGPRAQPQAWITYHLYYKAPDWLGPRIAAGLGIPYVIVEASVAEKRAGGPWSLGHEATLAALTRAHAVVSLNGADESGIAPHVRPARRHRLAPFLDAEFYAKALTARAEHRLNLARRYGLDPAAPWLLAVGMMRHGDKLASYKVLAEALGLLLDRPWQLLIVGDGVARPQVAAALAVLGARVAYAGQLDPAFLPPIYAASDISVWPAINEAYGVSLLESQAAGLPVVAGNSGGVGEVVADGESGLLTPPGDAPSFAQALMRLLDDAELRARFGASARAKAAAGHDILAASRVFDRVLAAATTEATR
jgi:glycosyltransferase involved in cell wall biosynthesis